MGCIFKIFRNQYIKYNFFVIDSFINYLFLILKRNNNSNILKNETINLEEKKVKLKNKNLGNYKDTLKIKNSKINTNKDNVKKDLKSKFSNYNKIQNRNKSFIPFYSFKLQFKIGIIPQINSKITIININHSINRYRIFVIKEGIESKREYNLVKKFLTKLIWTELAVLEYEWYVEQGHPNKGKGDLVLVNHKKGKIFVIEAKILGNESEWRESPIIRLDKVTNQAIIYWQTMRQRIKENYYGINFTKYFKIENIFKFILTEKGLMSIN